MGRGRPGSGIEPLKTCIRLTYEFRGKRCRETLDLAPTRANIKAAERMMADVRRQIALGIYDREATFPKPGQSLSADFMDYSESWLRTLVVQKATYRSYRSALRSIWQPAFKGRKLASIKPSEIKAIMAERAKLFSGKTVNNNLTPLRQIYMSALDDEIVEKSPLANIRPMKHQGPLPDPFDPEEMDVLLRAIEARYDERVWGWFAFAFATGLRPSEQVAVRWSDVDWRLNTIRIQRAHVRAETKHTKTAVIRDIDLNPRARVVLRRMKPHSFMRGSESQIFINPVTNRPWPDEAKQREKYFIPTLRATGIRHRHPYQTRHTFATIALMGGVNPAYIARQLGHVSTAMVFKHYAKWIDGADKGRESARMAALFEVPGSGILPLFSHAGERCEENQ